MDHVMSRGGGRREDIFPDDAGETTLTLRSIPARVPLGAYQSANARLQGCLIQPQPKLP